MGSSQIVELQPQDDLASIRHRLSWLDRGRLVLVLPWDLPFLSRPLDFDLLRREAERHQLEIAIVSVDLERRTLARACGFPSFASAKEAQETEVWRSGAAEQVQPPPRDWWDEEIDLRPDPVHSHDPWVDWVKLGARIAIFALALIVVVGSAYAIVPSGQVTLVPAGTTVTTIVSVSVDPEVESVDHANRLIPARRIGVEVEGYTEVETTGNRSVVAGRATGTVLFTNLLAQDYAVPAGTIVRTSSTSYPIRFRTTQDVVVPAGGQTSAPIEAMEDGVGNVGAFQINQVEGVAASAVKVTNPEPTGGADPRDVRVVTQADYDRAWDQLAHQLLDQAYAEMGHLLEPTEMLLRQSLRIEAVPKEAYTRFITEQADTVGLNMRLLVSGLAVDVDNAEAVAYTLLARQLPPNHHLVDAQFQLGEVAEERIGPGEYTFFVTAQGYAAAELNPDAAAGLIRGRRVAVARERLLAELPLAREPQIRLWPDWPEGLKWLERLPLLPLRINVEVAPKAQAVSQAD